MILLGYKIGETKEISDRLEELKKLNYISGYLLPCDGPEYEWFKLSIKEEGKRALESMRPINILKR